MVGIGATILANGLGAPATLVTLLGAWTIMGYLSLSDFGLTRAASLLVSHGRDPRSALESLRRSSWVVGVTLTLILGLGLSVYHVWASDPMDGVLWVLLPAPLITSRQFPLVGCLEAVGRFGTVAIHKVLSAVSTYGVPAALVGHGRQGLLIGLSVLVAYRALALVYLRSALPRGRAHGHEVATDESGTTGVVTWLGASSLLGPLVLYVDRAFAAASPTSVETLIAYTSMSEIMLRTYIVPTSVLAVVFPLTVRWLQKKPDKVRRAYGLYLPIFTLVGAVVLVAVVAVVPAQMFTMVGFAPVDIDIGRILLAILGVGTVVNWASQGQIALTQALGLHRRVVLAQLAMLLPYLVVLVVASRAGIVAVALVWLARILAMAATLWAMGHRGSATLQPRVLLRS